MKTLLTTALLCTLLGQAAQAQDLIVTARGDSVNCKITKINKKKVYFTYFYGSKSSSSILSLDNIRAYQYNFFAQPARPTDLTQAPSGGEPAASTDGDYQQPVTNGDYPRASASDDYQMVRIGVYGGWSYLTSRISEDLSPQLRQYVNGLRSGRHLGADLTVFVSENIGIGARYTRFRTSGELRSASVRNNTTGQMTFGRVSDDIAIRFIGPSFSTRISAPDRKSHFISGVSVGHLAYRNHATVVNDFTLTGNTWGLVWDVGSDVAVSEHVSLGFTISYTLGRLSQLNLNDGRRNRTIRLDEDEYEGLSRIDLTIGLRLNK